MNVENIPSYLKEHASWYNFRYEEHKGNMTKVPYNPATGYKAYVNKPETFTDFETVVSALKDYDGLSIRVDGIIIAIDLDHCIKDGKLTTQAADIVSHFRNTYIERSPSGTGLRIILIVADGFAYDKNTYYIKKSNVKSVEREIRESKKEYEQAQARINKLDTIIQRLYEDNIEGKISDERFMKMSATHEVEQNQLTELEHIIDAAREKSSNANSFLRLVKTYTDIKELNAEIIRTFIEKVYVYGNEKPWNRNTKKIKVIFNFIGEIHIPSNVKTA